MWGYGYGGGVTWWLVLIDVLIAALVIGGMVALVAFIAHRVGEPRSVDGDARRLLAERFARGEINEEEFRRRSAWLSSHTGRA